MLELSEKKAGGDLKFSPFLVRMKEAKHPALGPGPSAQVACLLQGMECPAQEASIRWSGGPATQPRVAPRSGPPFSVAVWWWLFR